MFEDNEEATIWLAIINKIIFNFTRYDRKRSCNKTIYGNNKIC